MPRKSNTLTKADLSVNAQTLQEFNRQQKISRIKALKSEIQELKSIPPSIDDFVKIGENTNADTKKLKSLLSTVETASDNGLLGSIETSKVKYLTPKDSVTLLASLGMNPDSTRLPMSRDWNAKNIESFATMLEKDIPEIKARVDWYNGQQRLGYQSFLDKDNKSAKKGGNLDDNHRKTQIEIMMSYAEIDSFRQICHAIPSIINKVHENISARVSSMEHEGNADYCEASTNLARFTKIKDDYISTFKEAKGVNNTKPSSKINSFRNTLDTYGTGLNDKYRKELLKNHFVSIHNVPFTDSEAFRSDLERMNMSLPEPVVTLEDVLEPVNRDTSEEGGPEKTVTTTFGISRDHIMSPLMQRLAKAKLDKRFEGLNYTASRQSKYSNKIVNILEDSIRLVADGRKSINTWREGYQVIHEIKDEDFAEHIKSNGGMDDSQSGEPLGVTSAASDTYKELVKGLRLSERRAAEACKSLKDTIQAHKTEINQSEKSYDPVYRQMGKVFSKRAEADMLRVELHGMILDGSIYDDTETTRAEMDKRIKSCHRAARESFEPFKDTPLKNINTWDEFMNASKQDKEESRSVLTSKLKSSEIRGWAEESDDDDDEEKWIKSLGDNPTWDTLVKDMKMRYAF